MYGSAAVFLLFLLLLLLPTPPPAILASATWGHGEQDRMRRTAAAAAAAVKETLESDPPYGAEVSFDVESAMGGWHAPEVAPWLEESMKAASTDFFGASAMYMGTGGSIPFMGMLGERFPGVQFLITGLLGGGLVQALDPDPHRTSVNGKSLAEADLRRRSGAMVIAVRGETGMRFNPDAGTQLEPGQKLMASPP